MAIIRRKPKGVMAKTYIDEIVSKIVPLDSNRNEQVGIKGLLWCDIA